MGTSPTESGRIPPDTASGNSRKEPLEYFASRLLTSFVAREGDTTPVPTFGHMYSQHHHIRGPDGPRGGVKALCGRRFTSTYGNRHLRGATSANVIGSSQGRSTGRYTARPLDGGYWYDYYTYRICRSCSREWVENALRISG